ncbi:MAG: efflux RND transporter periplasmic adaptor subunit [Chloroflexota bacterium]
MKKFLVPAIIIAVIIGAVYLYIHNRTQESLATLGNLQTMAAERGELIATVGATGTVRANQTTVLAWQTSGTVAGVNVKPGDHVSIGQVLAELMQTSLPQNVTLAQGDLINAQRTLEDLLHSHLQQAQAQKAVDDARQALEEAKNPDLIQAQALKAIAEAQKAVDDAEKYLINLQSPANQTDIDAAHAQVVLAEHKLEQAKDRFKPYASKPEDNLVRATLQSQLAAAQKEYDAAVRKLNYLLGTANSTEILLAEANLALAQANLAQAQQEWERVKNGPNPAEIAVLEAQLEDAERELARLKNAPDPDDIAVAEARIAAAQATVNTAHIAATFEATVSEVHVKPGDQVSPGSVAFRLDDLSHLLVDVRISEVDINRVSINQPVSLTFDAIPSKEYHGVVSEVALVGTLNQGIVEFNVTVELTDADEAVKPGMTAAVNIVVSHLTDVLLVPNRAVRLLDGKRVVYILTQGGAEEGLSQQDRSGLRGLFGGSAISSNQIQPVEITLGASSEKFSEVLSGDLRVGDQIVLNPPAELQLEGPPPFLQR